MIRYAWRDLLRNPRRTLAAMTGVMLGVGLFSGVLFFVDGSGATMTARAVAPLTLDIQRIVTAEPTDLRLSERISGADALGGGDRAMIEITVTNGGAVAANDVVIRDEPPRRLRYVPETTTLDGTHQPDIDGDSPLSHGIAGFGMNIGRLDAGASVTISYTVEATEAVARRRQPADACHRIEPRAGGPDRGERPAGADVGRAPLADRRDPRRRGCRRPRHGRPATRRARDGGHPRGRPDPGLRVRSALPRSLPVDPDRLGSARELGSVAQRRGGSLARRGARIRDRADGSRPGVATAAPDDRHRRSGPGAAALLEPQGEQARGIPLRPQRGRDLSRDVPRCGRPGLRPRASHGRHLHEELPGGGSRRAPRSRTARGGPCDGARTDECGDRGRSTGSAPVRGT